MMTFSRRARTKQYARGKDMLSARMTSAMHMVALRETPTLQWTKVAVPLRRPRSILVGFTLASFLTPLAPESGLLTY